MTKNSCKNSYILIFNPALQNKIVLHIFLFSWAGHFCPPGSDQNQSGSIGILVRIHNTAKHLRVLIIPNVVILCCVPFANNIQVLGLQARKDEELTAGLTRGRVWWAGPTRGRVQRAPQSRGGAGQVHGNVQR